MVVRLDSAKIEVEIDTRRAVRELGEVESQLDRARTRRRRGPDRVDPGAPGRAAARRLGAAAAVGAAGAGARAAGAAGGGLKRAVGLAAKVGLGISAIEAIRQAPSLLPAFLPREVLEAEIPPILLKLLGFDRDEGLNVAEMIRGLQKGIADLEAGMASTLKGFQLLNASLQEGKLVEAGFEGAGALSEAIRVFLRGKSPDERLSFPAFEELSSIFTAHLSYGRAERRFRQLTKEAENTRTVENIQRAVSAGGGGVSR